MTESPQYVIVHTRASERTEKFRTTLYDVHLDDSLEDVRERAAELERAANNEYGRVGDTYRVAELRYVDEADR
jgi:hypothetical protein